MQSLRTSRIHLWKLGEYVGFYSHFNHPERDWKLNLQGEETLPEPNLFGWRLSKSKNTLKPTYLLELLVVFIPTLRFIGQQ